MRVRITAAMAGMLLPLASVGLAGGVHAQTTGQYPPSANTMTVNRTEVPAGGVIEVSGRANPNVSVTFSLPARVLGTALTNNVGDFRAAVTIPCEVSGSQTLSTTGPGINRSTQINVAGSTEVCAQAAGTAGDTGGGAGLLPRTGSSSTAPLTAAGIGLVLIGAVTAVTARRRRRSESA